MRFQNITSRQYRSFVFLDHRRALFGAIRRAGRQQQPYLEISDPTNPTNAIVLELDESVLKHASQNSIINISLWTGAGREHGPLTGNGDLPFVPDTSRGIVAADVSLFHRDRPSWRDGPPRFESYVFLMDIEDTLAKDSSPPNLEQSCTEWEDLPSSAATFHYHSPDEDRYALSSRSAYVSGFRYASPVRPLLENSDGPRCFFVYDFNPYRETSGFLPSSSPEDPEPGVGYPRSASEITREVIGGLGCWRMRFDLPAKDENCTECHVSLTDGGVALFEVRWLMTCTLKWSGTHLFLTAKPSGRGVHYDFLDVVMQRVASMYMSGDPFRLGKIADSFRFAFGRSTRVAYGIPHVAWNKQIMYRLLQGFTGPKYLRRPPANANQVYEGVDHAPPT